MTSGNLTLTAAYGRRRRDVPTAAFGTVFNDPRFTTTDERGFVDLQFERAIRRLHLNVRAYADHYEYRGTYPYESAVIPGGSYVQLDGGIGRWWGTEARLTTLLAARHTVTGGIEFRRNQQQRQWLHDADAPETDFDLRGRSSVVAAYAQDEIAISDRIRVNAGARVDAYAGYARVTPRAAVIFNRSGNEAVKLLYGNAFRAPNAYEGNYYPLNRTHARVLRPESVRTTEVVWERYLGRWLRSSASAYTNRIEDLLTLLEVDGTDDALEGYYYGNAERAEARGIEFEAEMRARGARVQGSYALQTARNASRDVSLTNSPRHMGRVHAAVPVVFLRAMAAVSLDSLGSGLTQQGTVVPGSTLVHVTVTRPFGPAYELRATLRSVFGTVRLDPASAEHVMDAIPQYGRTFALAVRWKPARR